MRPGLFDTLKARQRAAQGGAEPAVPQILAFGVISAFCGQVPACAHHLMQSRIALDGSCLGAASAFGTAAKYVVVEITCRLCCSCRRLRVLT